MMRKLESHILEKVATWEKEVVSGKHRPFEIQLTFKIGRNGNDVIAFDSVLTHYVFYYVLGADAFNLSADHDEAAKIKIPLSKIQWENNYFFICSWLPGIPERSTFWTKRFEKQLLAAVDTRRISTRMGNFKSFHMPTLYDDRKTYILQGKGDIELIRKILPNPFHIGKKAGSGFGECEYRIREIPNAHALMSHNVLQRPLPVAYCEERGWKVKDGKRVFRPISPPYFGRFARKHECWDIGTILHERKTA